MIHWLSGEVSLVELQCHKVQGTVTEGIITLMVSVCGWQAEELGQAMFMVPLMSSDILPQRTGSMSMTSMPLFFIALALTMNP